MRHKKAGKRLGRTTSHRQAMTRNMVTSLLDHERIVTTVVKAKEIRKVAEKMITLAKRARILGMNTRNSSIIGLGMVPRGEVAMIVALIGLNNNLIQQDTYAALVLMSLITTIIPPLILRNWFYRKKTGKTPFRKKEREVSSAEVPPENQPYQTQ